MAETIPYSGYSGLVWSPKPCLANASNDALPKMRFDGQHYLRSYLRCRGRGSSAEDCSRTLPSDAHITPQNPLPVVYKKEIVDAIECMADNGDTQRCQHYLEGLHKKTHGEDPPISKAKKFSASLGLLGPSALPAAVVATTLTLIKIRI